jgi:two-component system LytT family response regulator
MSPNAANPVATVIADDEPHSRELLRHLLATHPEFRVVAECSDGEKALAAIKRHAPRVAFLDIKMPRLDGMTLLERLEPASRPLVVFTTAHDNYAIKAFAAHAFDYLLKPFDQERFDRTIARVREGLRQIDEAKLGQSVRHLITAPAATGAAPPPNPERIVVRETGRVYFVEVAEIEWLEASGNYVTLHVAAGKSHLVHETMNALEARLDGRRFVRIHRSTIVRLDRIKELLPHFNGEYVVVLKDGARLKLSRSYLESARAALGLG